jgi:prophage regulatory protein
MARTGLSRSVVYQAVSDGRFPKPVKIAPRAVAWVDEEIDRWIEQRVAERSEDQRRGAA